MARARLDYEIEQKVWRALAHERRSRGISQVYVAQALGISTASVSQLENSGVGHSLLRLRTYSVEVLRCKLTLELPGGVSLTPIERSVELTRSN